MKIRRRTRIAPFIPINSMSDIAFLLLIFIMLISLINYKKVIKIDYPEAEYKEVTQADKNFEIWIDSNGVIYYKGYVIEMATLEGKIVDAIAQDPETRIHIIADRNTKYKNVNNIIEILKLLQHRIVSFVVKGD
ncbi:MAG: biopolymer transporter ExbD [Spirochaetes bacterium]|nr:biopolymer transporter ExbD [Spirochaetota bacterium]